MKANLSVRGIKMNAEEDERKAARLNLVNAKAASDQVWDRPNSVHPKKESIPSAG